MFLPKIYPVTDTRISKLSHAAQVHRLIAGGATFIQLREKNASMQDFFADAAEAMAFARERGVKIIINDRVDAALCLRADGIHLGQDDLPPHKAREILGASAVIGFSTHNLEQAAAAVSLPIDYIAVGPIFDTRTKENPEKTVGLEMLKDIRRAVGSFPIVAIGGINSANFREVLNAGADSVAIISDLLAEPDNISNKIKEFL